MPVPASSFGREIPRRDHELARHSCGAQALFDSMLDTCLTAASHLKEAINA